MDTQTPPPEKTESSSPSGPIRIKIKHLLEKPSIGNSVFVQGWVRSCNDFKERSFIKLNDGSCMATLQIVAEPELENYEKEITSLGVGASISVEGTLVESEGKGQDVEILATKIVLIGSCEGDKYPIQKQGLPFEFLREQAHLRTRTNTFGAIARIRNELSFAVHRFFHEKGFLYVHSPIITASDTEGAGEMFQVTTLPLDNVPKEEGVVDYKRDFFDKPSFLTVSGQLNAEMFSCGLGDVYTFGPTFRAENSNTRRHLAEFWMIEPEMAFCDLKGNMELAESFIKFLLQETLSNCGEDMNFLDSVVQRNNKKLPQKDRVELLKTLELILESDFVHVTYTEAIKILKKTKKKFEYPVEWGIDLQSEHERFLTEQKFKKPVIVTDYPRQIKAFYMRLNEDKNTVGALDILVPRIGEILGGSQREERLDVLMEQIQYHKLDPETYDWYLDLRRFGSVPHSGFGLGFDRFVQYVTGMDNIRDAIPFPRTPGNVKF